jgi:RNA polymerase sigma-70 factor, ECF subfamily
MTVRIEEGGGRGVRYSRGPDMEDDVSVFEANRPALRALAYRMLGEMSRAEDIVQETWLRWQGRSVAVDVPRAFLLQVTTRLCLNELESARARMEESRADRLPEPVDLGSSGIGSVEVLDQISMAFLVLLQRLSPAERAVLLLHDVFELGHREIAALLGKTEAACRQLMRRARTHLSAERRMLQASTEEHQRLLRAFVRASRDGDTQQMIRLLAHDATLIIDAGPGGRKVGPIRSVGKPVQGAKRIAALLSAVAKHRGMGTTVRECTLNGQPAMVNLGADGTPLAAVLISVAEGAIQRVFVQVDPRRLRHLGTAS